MPRNISFALTTQQFRDQAKTVTRRLGWLKLKAGDELMGCVKCMGLKLGEKPERLGLIRVVDVRREPLAMLIMDEAYGKAEAIKEGFPEMSGSEFYDMFMRHMAVKESFPMITRIQFEYVNTKPRCCCGAWDDPASYGTGMDWDRSEDWCPVHGLGAKQ